MEKPKPPIWAHDEPGSTTSCGVEFEGLSGACEHPAEESDGCGLRPLPGQWSQR